MDEIKELVCINVTVILLVIFPIVLLVSGVAWYSSCQEAGIYNRINGTQYTCSDFFWASDQINAQSQTIKLTK